MAATAGAKDSSYCTFDGMRKEEDSGHTFTVAMSPDAYDALYIDGVRRDHVCKAILQIALNPAQHQLKNFANPTTNPAFTKVAGVVISPEASSVLDTLSDERKSELATLLDTAILTGGSPSPPPRPMTWSDKARLIHQYSNEIEVDANAANRAACLDFLLASLKAGLALAMRKPGKDGTIFTNVNSYDIAKILATRAMQNMDPGVTADDIRHLVKTSFKTYAEQVLGLKWINGIVNADYHSVSLVPFAATKE